LKKSFELWRWIASIHVVPPSLSTNDTVPPPPPLLPLPVSLSLHRRKVFLNSAVRGLYNLLKKGNRIFIYISSFLSIYYHRRCRPGTRSGRRWWGWEGGGERKKGFNGG
jgi:hypothetical protein